MQSVGIGGIILGIVLLVAAVAWPMVVPNKAVWNEEKAAGYGTASMTLHRNTFDKNISAEELAKSKAAYDELKRELDAAKFRKFGLAKYLRYTGIGISLLGLAIFAIGRQQED